jgi:formylglycine-generating enzyme required for sulfatase activity
MNGLFDVLGNVWEWCLDETAPDERALRGGAFKTLKTLSFRPMTEATPLKLPPNAKADDTGFRCILMMQP